MLDKVLRHRLPVWLGLLALLLGLFAPAARAAEDYLEPEAAFRFASRMLDPGTIEVTYQIADGYYMYRERFAFRAEGATLGEPVIPPGKVKFDETFQKDVETYRKTVVITIPVQATGPFLLVASSQGCADKGLCYTPMDSQARLSPTGGGGLLAAARGPDAQGAQDVSSSAAPASPDADSEMGRIESSLRSGRLLAIMPLFLLLGLGLSFTPCVLPMVPILSFIIVGEGAKATRLRGFLLSATYSLGMAIVYTLLGVSAGLLGEGLSAALQNPWVLSAFALLMAMLSLSMFGVYQLQMPAMVQTRLTQLSEKQTAGKLAGMLFMLLGAVQLAGLASGGRDPLAPLAHLGSDHHVTRFERVRSTAELDAALAQAKAQGKPAMLDFYADWCVSCKEMEKLTFTDTRVRQQFEGMVLLQADVTANNADDRALLKRFRLFGPPGIILFGKDGVEATQGRVIGYQDADRFLRSLAMVDR
jgi:thiol:disulfide interchange protein DsbD